MCATNQTRATRPPSAPATPPGTEAAAAEAAVVPFREDLTGAELPDGLGGPERERLKAAVGGAFVVAFQWTAESAAVAAALGALAVPAWAADD